MEKTVLVLGHKGQLSPEAEDFTGSDFFDFEKAHQESMQTDPCFAFAQRITDKYSAIANAEKLEVILQNPLNFEAIEQVQRNVQRRMNAVVSRIQKIYLSRVAEAESAKIGNPLHVGLPQFPAGEFNYARIA